MLLLDAALKRLVRQGTLTLIEPDGRTRHYGTAKAGWPDLAMRLADKGVAGAIARNPTLGLAECYMDGRLSFEGGDVMDFVSFIRRNNPWDSGRSLDNPGLIKRWAKRARRRWDQMNHRRISRQNVAHHYDLDDRLYDLFLDSNRQYSCAYWPEGVTTLEEAQVAKMDHIAAKLALKPGMRVLDIGCGWGGLALHLHRATGVEVHGVSLSTEQIAYARTWAKREGVADKVTFGLTDYRDVEGPFDRIVSVGMFEHVGVPQFEAFFHKCHDLLAPDGVMLLHTIGRAGPPNVTDAFTRKYIFPGGYIPSLSETMAAIEPKKLMLADCEILRRHYALTLREWYRRCVEQEARIVRVFDERFYRMWLFYLAGAATGFEEGDLVNFQLQLVRNRDAVPITRDYIHREETRLAAARSDPEKVVPLRGQQSG
ncbi:SAM-dependent methyltransferase [Novosphingobium cyanobacteriorum]|uniref:Cyclopropane-fatty-acyl-phospholipid synthase n=1 Tax=Novosphingobium cyanobacteriorum TaxID=3024215 RepID=A0ABT6CLH3_9SPHN|nr:cyclopropane-fatty-acyl-phospholipid synthase family protein [Novosphingobium cyanobacteriorum]MDF8334762.1 cyclopropane-fatty-acyl-phospholipid synthase [Novosphingobium cyanobacteriorum]